MKTVYCVMFTGIQCKHLCGVFSTREKAESYLYGVSDGGAESHYYIIEQWIIDEEK